VGAHYDSVEAGPGANDNGSGTAVLLETARVLAASGDDEGVCFVAFGAEEVGLFGSRSFVDGLNADERQALRGMVNVDMVGVGDRWQLFGSEELVADVDAEAAGLGLDPVPAEAPTGLSSDYRSFMDAGTPAVLIHRVDDPRYHSAEDKAQFVEPQALREAAQLTLLTLRLLGQP
jgi:aminopeptidase YwaD